MASLKPERTELEWTYAPSDFFEARYRYEEAEYEVVIERGRVVANLQMPQDPISPKLKERIQTYVTNAFLVSPTFALQGRSPAKIRPGGQ